MANKSGIQVTNSMFACLNLDDDMREGKKARRKTKNQNQTTEKTAVNENVRQPTNKDNKNEKKKTKEDQEKKQLQQLAFGRPLSGGKKKGKNTNTNHSKSEQNWDQWKQHDQEVVEDLFKQDLENALLESRLHMEQTVSESKDKQEKKENATDIPTTREERKKKKQKEKAKPMSLGEFKQLSEPAQNRKVSNSQDSQEFSPPPQSHQRVPLTEQDAEFFNDVHKEAQNIRKQDKIQEEYRKTYAADNAIVAKLKYDVELKDKKIQELKKQMEKMEAEMKQVKHRNKQLCVILAQGEMKDKAQVLLQVDELTAVKDELMEQVTSLTTELEKEKSKSSALKAEADKLKASKQSK